MIIPRQIHNTLTRLKYCAVYTKSKVFCHLKDIRSLDWDEYMVSYAYGARHYVMKGDPATIEASRNKGFILYRAHQALVFALFLAGLSILSLMDPFDIPVKTNGYLNYLCILIILTVLS